MKDRVHGTGRRTRAPREQSPPTLPLRSPQAYGVFGEGLPEYRGPRRALLLPRPAPGAACRLSLEARTAPPESPRAAAPSRVEPRWGEPAGRGRSLPASRLQPDAQYRSPLAACTDAGCAASGPSSARTVGAPPESAESVEVAREPPGNPEGRTRSYGLRRDGAPVYPGPHTRFRDCTLTPGVDDAYAVTAPSPPAQGRTSPAAPAGMRPVRLRAEGPRELRVSWGPPVRASGDTLSYTLFVRELCGEGETTTTHRNTTHSSFRALSLVVKPLKPFHR